MKSVLRLSGFALVSAAFLFAGCSKKPRPHPGDTMLGPGGTNLTGIPVDNPLTDASAAGLVPSDPWDQTRADRTTLAAETVYFGFDSAAISQSERAKVQKVADYLKQHPGTRMRIEGHCDWRGTTEYNLGLGDRRAKAVKDYLTTLGADVSTVEINSQGDQGATENASESTMKLDRHAAFAIAK